MERLYELDVIGLDDACYLKRTLRTTGASAVIEYRVLGGAQEMSMFNYTVEINNHALDRYPWSSEKI
ncbi:hypothetical protein [Synechococcus sp. CC9616]|uniref:hypothetical protein n=1 Tax=Synechococcus sp. CC9616 TaxID=110663 RepID=UPI000491ACE8|nr:hypothetical protein [Synechococcus sp. CC9616]